MQNKISIFQVIQYPPESIFHIKLTTVLIQTLGTTCEVDCKTGEKRLSCQQNFPHKILKFNISISIPLRLESRDGTTMNGVKNAMD